MLRQVIARWRTIDQTSASPRVTKRSRVNTSPFRGLNGTDPHVPAHRHDTHKCRRIQNHA